MAKGFHKTGFDGWSPIDAAAAKSAGAIACQGYLVGDTAMTREWVQSLTDVGLLVWSGWELAANAPENGAPQGVSDATAAVAAAQALGQPKGSAIYFSNDSVISDLNAVVAYYHAVVPIVEAAGYKTGLYGQTSLQQIVNLPYFWHASDGTPPPWPGQIVQPNQQETLSSGETVDVDEINSPDFGGWNYAPPPDPQPPEDDDMYTLIKVDPSTYYLDAGYGPVKVTDGTGDLAVLQKSPAVREVGPLTQALVDDLVAAAKKHLV